MFCLSGQSSRLSCDIFPSLDLSKGEWEIGLIDLTTYNSIPNIEEGVNNLFHYGDSVVKIPTGSYEISDLEEYINKNIDDRVKVSLKPNNSTLKVEMTCSEPVHFEKPFSIASLLGFKEAVYEPNIIHTSDKEVNIITVNVIEVTCNVAHGSYRNGKESHIIHEFYPSVPPGYKIIEKPHNVIYLPVNSQALNNITCELRDQSGKLVNFRNETISLRLHLRQRNGFSI